uniref:Uncharacterized protein n=1 Tax=Cucumis melo TaxID=3656 RepID=A0A9I9E137_CUCME
MIGHKANVGGFLNPPWMRKNMNSHSERMFNDRKWIVPFFATLLISVTLLTNLVKADSTFNEVENVCVMAQSNLVTYKGPTMIACTLQAIS